MKACLSILLFLITTLEVSKEEGMNLPRVEFVGLVNTILKILGDDKEKEIKNELEKQCPNRAGGEHCIDNSLGRFTGDSGEFNNKNYEMIDKYYDWNQKAEHVYCQGAVEECAVNLSDLKDNTIVLRPLDNRPKLMNSKCQWEILTDPFKVVTVTVERDLGKDNKLDISMAFDIAGSRNPKYYHSADFYDGENKVYTRSKEKVLRVIVAVQILSAAANYTITINQTDPVKPKAKFIEERDGKIIIDEQLLVDKILWLIIFILIVGIIVTLIVYSGKSKNAEYQNQDDTAGTDLPEISDEHRSDDSSVYEDRKGKRNPSFDRKPNSLEFRGGP